MEGGGVLAGYEMVDVKGHLYDGSYHDVDSNEMAFKIAARCNQRGRAQGFLRAVGTGDGVEGYTGKIMRVDYGRL